MTPIPDCFRLRVTTPLHHVFRGQSALRLAATIAVFDPYQMCGFSAPGRGVSDPE